MRYFKGTAENFLNSLTLDELGCETYVIDSLKELDRHGENLSILIDHFNSYIEWDGMFDFLKVIDRIKDGHILVMTYFEGNPVGYVFINNGWIFNLFVTKLNERPNKTFVGLSNKSMEVAIDRFGIAAWECEDWNKPMHFVAKQAGIDETDYSLKSVLNAN